MGKGSKPHRSPRPKGKPLGSSKAGRPKLEGERFPSGKLKPRAPNARVVAERRALLGAVDGKKVDISKAENALDLAVERGWMTELRHRTARVILGLHLATRTQGPRVAVSKSDEAKPSAGVLKTAISGMTQSEIAAVWDAAMPTRAPRDMDEGAEKANARLKQAWGVLTPDERKVVFEECVMGSWPQWVIWLASGLIVPAGHDRRRLLLESGLDKIAAELRVRCDRHASAA